MTKAQGQAFRRRWERVNAREVEELRSASVELRWQQFKTLLAWAREYGWEAALAEGEEEVRQRWITLRRKLRG